jgi:uncharacterized membrane protein HdeD (DUF308 family)
MKAFRVSVRIAAWLLGLFVLVSGAMDVLGLIPYSDEMPHWRSRLVSSLPSMLSGVVLLMPMSRFLFGRRYLFLAVAYCALVSATAVMAALGIHDYVGGTKHWGVIPASLVFFAIPFSNALLLWRLHRGAARAPDNAMHATCEDARA